MSVNHWIYIGIGSFILITLIVIIFVLRTKNNRKKHREMINNIQRNTNIRTYDNPVYDNPDQNNNESYSPPSLL